MSDTAYRPTTSDSIAQIAAALAKAQGKFTNPQKDRDNPFFKSKYATLDALIDCTRAVLSENELSIVQVIRTERGMELSTRLMHSSGEWIESNIPLVTAKDGAQKLGSEITYMRRYCYAAILSITADEDEDGNLAQSAVKKPAQTRQSEPPRTEDRSATMAKFGAELLKDLSDATTMKQVAAIDDKFKRAQAKGFADVQPEMAKEIATAIVRSLKRVEQNSQSADEPDFVAEEDAAGALRK